MGNISVARRHPDYPVEINGTFAKRVQSIDLNKNIPTTPTDELGNASHAGVDQDAAGFTATLTWYPLDATTENLFAATSGSVVTLPLLSGNMGVNVKTPVLTLAGVRVVGLEYSTQAQQQWRATARLKGTSWTAATNTITATAPSGVGAYRAKNVKVQVGNTVGVRVAGVTVRADLPNQDLYELNNANPVGTIFDAPNVSVDVDFYESSLAAGNIETTAAAPQTITVTVIDDTAVTKQTLTCGSMVCNTQSQRGTINGWATRRYSYTSAGNATTGGLSIA